MTLNYVVAVTLTTIFFILSSTYAFIKKLIAHTKYKEVEQ